MIKNIQNNWEWGSSPLSLLSIGRNFFVKQSSHIWYKKYTPEKNSVFVLVLALGAGEYYGPNRNGDYFSKEDLFERHPTFVSDGKHYKHHVNKDPKKCYGDVMESYYNPQMHRVELIVRLNKEDLTNKDMIDKIEAGEPVPVSMAARVPYDVCSICGNKAKTLAEYCTHLNNEMLSVKSDGRQVFALNPNPTFFDISEVVIGADPTAHTLKKVACLKYTTPEIACNTIKILQKNVELSKMSSYNNEYLNKLSLLKRLAELEKKIQGVTSELISKKIKTGEPIELEKDAADFVATLSSNRIGLKVSDLYDSREQQQESIKFQQKQSGFRTADVRNMYSTLLNHPQVEQIVSQIPLNGKHSFVKNASDRELSLANLSETPTTRNPVFNCSYSDLIKVAALNLVSAYKVFLEEGSKSEFPYLLVTQNLTGV